MATLYDQLMKKRTSTAQSGGTGFNSSAGQYTQQPLDRASKLSQEAVVRQNKTGDTAVNMLTPVQTGGDQSARYAQQGSSGGFNTLFASGGTGFNSSPGTGGTVQPIANTTQPVNTTVANTTQPVAQPTTPDINSMSEGALQAKLKAIQAGVDASKIPLQDQINNASKTYDPMRNEAYTNDQTAQRTLRERLANMGLGATGGKSLTLESNRDMSLQNRLGDISRQQQQLVDDTNSQINQLVADGKTQEAQAVAEEYQWKNEQLLTQYNNDRTFEYQKSRDAIGDSQWQKNFDAQQGQFDYQKTRDLVTDEQWEQNFGSQEKSEKFSQAWSLYTAGGITKEQFKKMTGISVKTLQSAKRGGGSSGTKKKATTGDDYAQGPDGGITQEQIDQEKAALVNFSY